MIARIVMACANRAWVVVAIATMLGAGALVYVCQRFAMDTDTAKLIAEDQPWRVRERAFDAAFPHRANLIAIVIDGATADVAERAAAAMAQRLSKHTDVLRAVWRPDGGPFFDHAALMYLPEAELAQAIERVVAAEPLLGSLASDPSLRGLMDTLSTVAEGIRSGHAKLNDVTQPFTMLADAFDAYAAGQTPAFAWTALIAGHSSNARALRRFILVDPVLDYGALQPGERASAAIRQTAHQLRLDADPHVRIRLTGPVPIADEEFATLAEGAALNIVALLGSIVALLWLALRSARLIAAVLLNLGIGLIVTAAFGLFVFGSFNLISIAFAVLFVGLGVDFGIQFCVCYRAKRHEHDELCRALRDAGREIGGALALAAGSTAAGFFAFLPTAYRGVSTLGAIAGTGMIVAFVATITLLPALLALLRPPSEPTPVGYVALAPLERFLIRRRRGVLMIAGLIALVSAALLAQLQFDFNPLHLRSEKVESMATLQDLMRDPDTTPNTIDVVAPSVADAEAVARRLEELPEVDHAITLGSFVPEQQQAKRMLIDDAALLLDPVLNPGRPRAPPSDADNVRAIAGAAQRLEDIAAANRGSAGSEAAARLANDLKALARGDAAQRERVQAALMPGLVATLAQLRAAMQPEAISLETLPPELKRDWIAADGRARIEVFPKGNSNDNATLSRFVAAVRTIAPQATGAPVSIQESTHTIVYAFLQAGLWALAAITLLLALTLRRIADVALTLAPLALSTLATLGLCAAIGIPLNFENIIALPLLLGIGVAFNIYFVMAWRAGRTALLESSLTRAVIFSALTTGTGFGSLWLSHHPGTSSMGKLLSMSLACTLASALLFLPPLLRAWRRSD